VPPASRRRAATPPADTRQFSPVEKRFPSLSLRDVLEARDAYHIHLLAQPHVVATAVGRYLVRTEEASHGPFTLEHRLSLPPGERPPRTLENSHVAEWSWPAVVVFVDAWMDARQIAKNPDDMVPRRLYLPNGKIVPTCVVYAPSATTPSDLDLHLNFPSELLGGGYVCVADVQGSEHVGSIACLVSDGVRTYALTNRHVAGETGRELFSMVDGTYVRIGHASDRAANRAKFTDLYPGFPGERVEVAIDAGLIDVDDVNSWTTQVFGVGTLTDIYDVSVESLTLDLVGTPVSAFGAASGSLVGEILALYYRYRTRSGVEYVADALVGPQGPAPLQTRPGDSGTLWSLATGAKTAGTPTVRPIAMQWGGHRFESASDDGAAPYALVTFLSNVCRALDVEVVYDWNTGQDLYWGQVGHYTIGAKACELVEGKTLRAFFLANRTNISFDLGAIADGAYQTPNGTIFYPLADVPDLVWKQRGGPGRPHEGPNHFADMDEADPATQHTLLGLFHDDPTSVTPHTWIDFYEAVGKTPHEMGLLPFRVAQLYTAAVASLSGRTPDVDAALCALGAMAHYVGDACQPLHVSQFHHGRSAAEANVHSDFETKMVGANRKAIIDGLATKLRRARPLTRVKGQAKVAQATVALMDRTFKRIPPEHLCDVWVQTGGHSDQMWAALGTPTIECMADGCRTLAMLWSSAFAEAGARAPAATAADRTKLRNLYSDHAFVPSQYLTERAADWPA
jgi:hypothetical protein